MLREALAAWTKKKSVVIESYLGWTFDAFDFFLTIVRFAASPSGHAIAGGMSHDISLNQSDQRRAIRSLRGIAARRGAGHHRKSARGLSCVAAYRLRSARAADAR